MSRLATFVVIVILGVAVFQHFKKQPAPPAPFKDAPVKARQGLIDAHSHKVLAINGADYIYGFGDNQYLDLGIVGFDSVTIPKLVSDQRSWRFVHSGTWVSFAIDQNGTLFRRPHLDQHNITQNDRASLGSLIPYLETNPEQRFLKAMEVYEIAAALDTSKRLWVWRETLARYPSRFLDHLNESAPERIEVLPLRTWRDFCISDEAMLAVDGDGALWELSEKAFAEARNDHSSPTMNVTLTRVNSIAPPAERVYCSFNSDSVILQDSNGELWGYGSNKMGELGLGNGEPATYNRDPVNVITRLAPGRYSEVVTAPAFTLAIHRDGSLWAWGVNTSGQLGIGKETSGVDRPQLVDRSHIWIAIAAGHDFSAGITSQGELFTWGSNTQGCLGEGGNAFIRDRPLPVFDNQTWGGAER